MKRTIFGFILAISLAILSLAFSVSADDAQQFSVSAEGDYTSVEAALAAAENMAKESEVGESGIRLVLNGSFSATVDENGVLFGQKTIFLPNGKKLPIEITGGTLNLPAGRIACANDYHFTNITLPLDETETKLFAGSGDVTISHVTLDTDGSSERKGRFYGDNFTAAVFAGWTGESLALYTEDGLFSSSMTLGEGVDYVHSSAFLCAAVGSSTDFEAFVGDTTLTAAGTRACLILDGATLGMPFARTGTAPVGDSLLLIKSGSFTSLRAAGFGITSEVVGDITVKVLGGSFSSYVRILKSVHVKGDLSVSLANIDLMQNTGTDGHLIEMAFDGCSITGDLSVSMQNVKGDRYYQAYSCVEGFVTGDVTTKAENCNFSKLFYGGFGEGKIYGNVKNTILNCHLGTDYKGAYQTVLIGDSTHYTGEKDSVGNLSNTLENVSFDETTSTLYITMGSSASCTVSGNISNRLKDVTIPSKSYYLILGNKQGTVLGSIENTLTGDCNISATIYGGNDNGEIQSITNHIESGTYPYYAYLAGKSTVKGLITNYISGGDFSAYYVFGGVNGGKVLSPEEAEYGVRNYISGGIFHGFWGGSAGGSATHRGNIYTEVTGGTFLVYSDTKYNSFSGGCRNGAHEGNAVSVIRGGTFQGLVAGGSIPNQESFADANAGSSLLTVAGGTFQSEIIPGSLWGSYAESSLVIETARGTEALELTYPITFDTILVNGNHPVNFNARITCSSLLAKGPGEVNISAPLSCESLATSGGKINLYASTSCETLSVEEDACLQIYAPLQIGTLEAGGHTVILGAKGEISASSVSGKLVLLQKECWLDKIYLTAPAGTDIEVQTDKNGFGEYAVQDGVVKGISTTLIGASFVFTDTVSLRFAFDRETVDAAGEAFTFTATIGERTLVSSAGKEDLEEGMNGSDPCYTLLTSPLSAIELCKKITYEGSIVSENSFTLLSLASTGIEVFGKEEQNRELGELLRAFSNYAVASNNFAYGNTAPLPYENLASPTGYVTQPGPLEITNTSVTLDGRKLLLDSGFRIRYNGTLSYAGQSKELSIIVNNKDLTDTCNLTEYEDLTFTFDIPVKSSQSRQYQRLYVKYGDKLCVDYVDRLDTLAEDLSQKETAEELGSALLYYLQSGYDYFLTQPDLSEIALPETFSVGFGREDVSPYGFEVNMYSGRTGKEVLDPICITCIAFWDGEEIALYFSVDVRQCNETVTKTYKEILLKELEEFDIDPDKIFFNATHNHSGPNSTVTSDPTVIRWNQEYFYPGLIMSAKNAILDLAPATAYAGTALSDPGTNYVRRYLRADGSYTGIHNIVPSTNIVDYESVADKELRTIRFERGDKKDILMANWQGHAAHGVIVYNESFTADFIATLRTGVEEEMGVHFVYCNGSSGNLNFTAKLGETYFKANDFYAIGTSLAGTVKKAVSGESAIATGKLQVTYIPFEGIVKQEDEETIARAIACRDDYQSKVFASSSAERKYIQENYGFNSTYEVSSIITRSNMEETALIPCYAFSFGDIGFSFVPFEQFDSNGKAIRDASPFAMTFSCGYTNGSKSYIPSAFAAPHGGYEVYTCRYIDQTGDDIAAAMIQALNEMK